MYNEDVSLVIVGEQTIRASNRAAQLVVEELEAKSQIVQTASYVAAGTLPALCAAMGGYVAQEGLKAVMAKFTPLQQWTYIACEDVIPQFDIEDPSQSAQFVPDHSDPSNPELNAGQLICLGRQTCQQLADLKVRASNHWHSGFCATTMHKG